MSFDLPVVPSVSATTPLSVTLLQFNPTVGDSQARIRCTLRMALSNKTGANGQAKAFGRDWRYPITSKFRA